MDFLVAPVDHIEFDMETALARQLGSQPLPFPGMDKSGAAVCELYVRASCDKGASCPFRHVRGDKTIVCKHWLRGTCKKGDHCEFLHEYDMSKMPQCYFYAKFRACHAKDCPFRHTDPDWYATPSSFDQGPTSRNRQTPILCKNFLAGFCSAGSNCTNAHPRSALPSVSDHGDQDTKKFVVNCHYCGEEGHKVSQCSNLAGEQQDVHEQTRSRFPFAQTQKRFQNPDREWRRFKPLDEIVCYKCGDLGHFANKCSRGNSGWNRH